jgi:hypothetical protein
MVFDGMAPNQFFEGAETETPTVLFLAPIILAVLFLPVIDFAARFVARIRGGRAPEAMIVTDRREARQ